MKTIGIITEDTCRLCFHPTQKESTDHLTCDCEGLIAWKVMNIADEEDTPYKMAENVRRYTEHLQYNNIEEI